MNDIEEAFRRARAERFGIAPGAHQPAAPAAATVAPPWPLENSIAPPATCSKEPRPAPGVDNPAAPARPALSPELASRVVTDPGAPEAATEQFRKLAALLHDEQRQRGIRVVMVASALGREGKSLTAVNLALTLTKSYGRHVLLVDADLRRPSLQRLLGVVRCEGLNETIRAGRLPKPVAVSPGLSLIAGGSPSRDPMRVLTSAAVRTMLEQAAAEYDWVIVDTPPITIVPDGHLVAELVDAAVLVVSAGRTSFARVRRAAEAIGGQRLLGVILNGVERGHLIDAGGYDESSGYCT